MSDLEPITRDEVAWSNGDLEPITRKEKYIKHLYDETQEIPDPPQTREEWFIKKAGEEIHDVTIEPLTVTQNGVYSESGKAYSPVTVAVPLGSKNITANGIYNASDDNLAGYGEVTVAVEGYAKKSISNTPTDIATFNASALPMPSLTVGIEAVQSGSGDPSPTNVRPIIGWSAVNVTRCGKNLIPYVEFGILNQTDDSEEDSTSNKRTGFIRTLPNTQYTISGLDGSGISIRIFEYKKDKTYIRNYVVSNITNSVTIQTGAEVGFICFQGNEAIFTSNTAQCEKGNRATSYEPYNGQTYTIDLDGTRYGGTLDVVSGVLTVDRAYVDLGTLNWTYYSGNLFTSTVSYLKPVPNEMLCNALCSIYVAKKGIEYASIDGSFVAGFNNSRTLAIHDSRFTNATDFKTAMKGVQLVYELTTPQTYQLTPTQVSTLLGQNNIFADCGQVLEGEYFVTL